MRKLLLSIGSLAALAILLTAGRSFAESLSSPTDQAGPPLEIAVTMTEWEIAPRHIVVKANQPVRFTITNPGQSVEHRFNVVGQDQRWRGEPPTQPGQTSQVEATFTTPGIYQIYCSTGGNHRDFGMVGTLTVVEETADPALRIPVSLTEFQVQPLGLVTVAGQTTRFELTNLGEGSHNFVVMGQGMEYRSPTVRVGTPIAWDTVFEKAGTYEVFCSFRTGDSLHKDLGMVGVLEVLPGGMMMMPSM